MKKEDIGGILFSIRRNSRLLCELRFDANGDIYRTGNGTKPCGDLIIRGNPGHTRFWNEALKAIPEHIISSQLFGPEHVPPHSTEYQLLFTPRWVSLSAENHTGIRIVHQPQGTYSHPLMPLLLKTGEALMSVTDKIYLDAFLQIVYDIRPEDFSKSIEVWVPRSFSEKQAVFQQYVQEIDAIGKFRKLLRKIENKTYFDPLMRPYRVYFNYGTSAEISVKPHTLKTAKPAEVFDNIVTYRISRPKYIRGETYLHSGDLPVHLIPPFFAALVLAIFLAVIYLAV